MVKTENVVVEENQEAEATEGGQVAKAKPELSF